MLHIQHEQPMRKSRHALQAKRHAAQIGVRIKYALGVDAPACNARVADLGNVDETVLLRRGQVDIVDVAESGIEAFVEREAAAEEVEAAVGVEEVEGLAVGEEGEGEG